MFPPTYSICLGTSCSNVQFCAYHSNATYAGTTPFTYTILPESTPPDAGCGANYLAGGLGNLTSMVSHEMVESMTDAEVGSATTFAPPLAWYDPASEADDAPCAHGNANVLTRDRGTSRLSQGASSATALVQVERCAAPPPVRAFTTLHLQGA